MSEIVVRAMEENDISYAVKIENECFSIPWSENSFRESLSKPYAFFLVVCVDSKIAGYAGMYKIADEGDITNIAILNEYRHRGLASRLLEEMFFISRVEGIGVINLEVRKSNYTAIKLYEKYGFENLGIRKNFYEKPTEDAFIMKKIIEK